VTLEIDVLTLFPQMLEGPLTASIPGRIREQGLAVIRQAEAPSGPVQQPDAEMCFELRDLAVDGGDALPALARHGGEGAGFHHPDEAAQAAEEIHDFTAISKNPLLNMAIISRQPMPISGPSQSGIGPDLSNRNPAAPAHHPGAAGTRRQTMRTMLLAAAAALTLSAGAALADNGEDLGWAFSPNVPTHATQAAQPAQAQVVAPDNAPAVVIGQAVS